MTKPRPLDYWRSEVAAMLESGMSGRRWARERGIPHETFHRHLRNLLEEDPELFAPSPALCPCPLMTRLLPYGDPAIRKYLKHLWFELASLVRAKAEGADLPPAHTSFFKSIAGSLPPDASAADVGSAFLLSLGEGAPEWMRRRVGLLTRAAALAAVSSGVNDGDPFFEWLASNEAEIRAARFSGGDLRRTIERRACGRTRVMLYRKRAGVAAVLVEYDASTPFCLGLLDGFAASRSAASLWGDSAFFAHFEESMGFAPRSLDDFTVETFDRQLKWFDERYAGVERACALRLTRLFYMHVIEMLPEDQQVFSFATGLPPKALGYGHIVPMWLKGYRAVAYEPLDPAPPFLKWLLYPNAGEALKTSLRIDAPKPVDCSVGDPSLERLLVDWLWHGGLGSTAVRKGPMWARPLLRILAEDPAVFRDGAGRPVVEPRHVHAALSDMEGVHGKGKGCEVRGKLRAFLRFGEKSDVLNVEPACYLLLESPNCSTVSGSAKEHPAVPDEHLAALAGELERRGESSVSDELTYIAFVVQALTDIRAGEVLSLKIGDLDASFRKGISAVRVCRKCGGYDYEVVQVPEEVHRLLQVAARITEPVRARADEAIADRVFLVDGAMGMARILSKGTCDTRLRSACKRLGIPQITSGDVRRTFQTTVIMEGAKRNWNRMMLRPITGHADVRSDEPYIAPDIMDPETRRYLEGAYVVEIGRPKIRGKVLPDEEVPHDLAVLVEGGAGVCRNADCDVLGTLPCFECRSFATAPRLIPEMVELVAAIDEQMASAPLHQREHLVTAKRRALAYLGAMIDMRKRKEAADGEERGA